MPRSSLLPWLATALIACGAPPPPPSAVAATPALDQTDGPSAPGAALDGAAGNGHLPPEVIKAELKKNMPAIEACYAEALERRGKVGGTVRTRLLIGEDGRVRDVADAGSTLPDPDALRCMRRAYGAISFPRPEGGSVLFVHPLDMRVE